MCINKRKKQIKLEPSCSNVQMFLFLYIWSVWHPQIKGTFRESLAWKKNTPKTCLDTWAFHFICWLKDQKIILIINHFNCSLSSLTRLVKHRDDMELTRTWMHTTSNILFVVFVDSKPPVVPSGQNMKLQHHVMHRGWQRLLPISLHCERNSCKMVDTFFGALHPLQNDLFWYQDLIHSVRLHL